MQTKRTVRMLMTLALAAPLAAFAAAEDKPAFEAADADGNGRVAVSEAVAAGVPKNEAEREDIDDDGQLTGTDWRFIDMNPAGEGGSGSS